MISKHSVERLAIIQAEVMSSGIVIHMSAQIIFLAIQFKGRSCGSHQRLHSVRRGEATVVLGVERQQCRTRSHHCGEVSVIDNGCKIAWRLLRITKVLEVVNARKKARIASDRIREFYARV